MATDPARSRVVRRLGVNLADSDGAYVVLLMRPDGGVQRSWGAQALLSLAVRGGREGANETFPASTLTWSIPVDSPADLDGLAVGSIVEGEVSAEAWDFLVGPGRDTNVYRRVLRAIVTDLALDYRPQGPGRPPQAVVTVTAMGPKARAGQTRIGAGVWSAESTTDRRYRIQTAINDRAFTDAIWTPKPFGNWTGSSLHNNPQVAFRDVDRAPGLDVLEELAADTGALLYESLCHPGRVLWSEPEYRDGRLPLVTLTPAEIAATATWGMSLNGLVNRFTVEYGPEGDRREVTVEDAWSIAEYGEYAEGRSTQLLTEADAHRLARLTVGRNSRPVWTITRLDVDLLDLALPKAKAAELCRAEVGDLIELTGLPTTAPGETRFYVEGAEMSVTAHDWRLTVFLSDVGRTGAPLAWNELPADLTWADTPPTRTWLNAAGWYVPPPATYRWSDVPGNQRWWALAPGETRTDADPAGPSWATYPADDPAT